MFLRQETKILFEKSELNFESLTWSSLDSGKMNLDVRDTTINHKIDYVPRL